MKPDIGIILLIDVNYVKIVSNNSNHNSMFFTLYVAIATLVLFLSRYLLKARVLMSSRKINRYLMADKPSLELKFQLCISLFEISDCRQTTGIDRQS